MHWRLRQVWPGARAEGEALAVDQAGAGNGDVGDVFAPDEGVVPVVVAVVLEGVVGGLGLGGVVSAAHVAGGLVRQRRGGGFNDGALGEEEVDLALEPDGEAHVGAGREYDCSATGCVSGLDGLVDGWGVDGFAVALSAVGANVEEHGVGVGGGDVSAALCEGREGGCGGGG
jgi:hypothetical protein